MAANVEVYPGSELTGSGPVRVGERINSLDIFRGVALFGILLMNIAGMGLPFAYSDPTVYGGAQGLDLAAWITTSLFFEGTMRGLFSLLFGAGVILLTQRAEASGAGLRAADIYYRRNVLLVLFGMVHAYLLLWTGDILYYYGLVALFLFPLRHVPPRWLLIGGLAANLVLLLWTFGEHRALEKLHDEYASAIAASAEGYELDEEAQDAIEAWQDKLEWQKPDADTIEQAIEMRQGGYLGIVAGQAGEVMMFESKFAYRYMFLDALAFMLFGMALMKLGVLTLNRSRRFYLSLVLVGYAVGLGVNAWEIRTQIQGNFEVLAISKSYLTYEVGRLGMTAGHVGLLALFCSCNCLGWLKLRLAAVGRMALTNYITHSVIAMLVFTGVGFALFGELSRHQLYYVVFGTWIFQLIVSPIWLRHFRFGPLEWCWRSLTYLERQPMRRDRALEAG